MLLALLWKKFSANSTYDRDGTLREEGDRGKLQSIYKKVKSPWLHRLCKVLDQPQGKKRHSCISLTSIRMLWSTMQTQYL